IQRPPLTRDLKEVSSVSVSALALIIRLPIEGSAVQCGINPQCISLHSLPPLRRTITGIVGEICSGATLKRGVYFVRSRSKFHRTRMSLNSNVALKRPHIRGCHSAALANGQDGRQSSPCTALGRALPLHPCC